MRMLKPARPTPLSLLPPLLADRAPDLLRAAYGAYDTVGSAVEAFEPTPRFLSRQYREHTGKTLNLKNPRGFSEKLNWLKLQEPTDLQIACADKVRVRSYVEERVGGEVLPELYLSTERLRDIRPERIIADKFVLKPNHSWGGVEICTDASQFDWSGARARLARNLSYNNWRRHREPVYRHIKPLVLAEELLTGEDAGLKELKFLCFSGEPRFVMLIMEEDGETTKTLLDDSWRRLDTIRHGARPLSYTEARPSCFGEMLDMAAKLSDPFLFCRIDFYLTSRGPVFSEVTFFPKGGLGLFDPPEWERRLGDCLKLPIDAASSAGPH